MDVEARLIGGWMGGHAGKSSKPNEDNFLSTVCLNVCPCPYHSTTIPWTGQYKDEKSMVEKLLRSSVDRTTSSFFAIRHMLLCSKIPLLLSC